MPVIKKPAGVIKKSEKVIKQTAMKKPAAIVAAEDDPMARILPTIEELDAIESLPPRHIRGHALVKTNELIGILRNTLVPGHGMVAKIERFSGGEVILHCPPRGQGACLTPGLYIANILWKR
jgi:hypothetical protein